MIENSDISKDFQMIGARVGFSALRLLKNKSYRSSPRFYHFVKYGILNKTPVESWFKNEDQTFSVCAANNILLNAMPVLSQSIGSSDLVPRIARVGEPTASWRSFAACPLPMSKYFTYLSASGWLVLAKISMPSKRCTGRSTFWYQQNICILTRKWRRRRSWLDE
jgi:hypothetical protein